MILDGKRVLVTGGTGSLGGKVVRALLRGDMGRPAGVTVFSRDEAKQNDMRLSYLNRRAATDEVIYTNSQQLLNFRIGDVRDYAAMRAAVQHADIVINAAALKQVPTCEYFPFEAVQTNVIGAAESRARHPRERRARRDGRRHLHRQSVQADQRHGHDQGAAWSAFSSRPTSTVRRRDSSASATATSSPRAARSSRSSSNRSSTAAR